MKLELKHLAPYLPYELKIARLSIDGDFKRIEYSFRATNLVEVLRYDNLKPILRPLSDLTKEIEVNGEKFVPIMKLAFEYNLSMYQFIENKFFDSNYGKFLELNAMPYFLIKKLFEWHFDIFGLIEKGLAIDINTLPQSSE